MRHQLELIPIEYHLAYYPLVVDADWSAFEKFIETIGGGTKHPDYMKFATNMSRLEVIRECAQAFKKEFSYVLVFDKGDGNFFIEARPKACLRACMRLSASDQKDMMKCFDEVASAIEDKANLKYEADKKRQESF